MDFKSWKQKLPDEFKEDPVWTSKAYQLALFMADICWKDVTRIYKDKRTGQLSDQLYNAIGSISANISEGYSRKSKKSQATFYEYALGSAREARGWYYKSRHLFEREIIEHRIAFITQIIKILMKTIPERRTDQIKEEKKEYSINEGKTLESLLSTVPLPERDDR